MFRINKHNRYVYFLIMRGSRGDGGPDPVPKKKKNHKAIGFLEQYWYDKSIP